ncbi:MAG: two-component system sensor histidine kinase NtrB, partial [Acetobacteraceae bacterium]
MRRAAIEASGGAAMVEATAVLEALPLAVAVLDARDRFVFANRAAEEFFRSDSRRLQTAHLAEFLPESCRVAGAIAEVRRTRTTLTLHDVALESPRLARLSVDATLAPFAGLEGGVLLGLGAARKSGDGNTESPSPELAGMAAVLAHEVKNPLSGIRGAAQLLEASLGGEERELAILIRGEADRIRSLVDRVALLGGGEAAKTAVDIHDVLGHVRRLAARGFASRVRFREAYDPSLPPAAGNRDQLVQVLLNLVKNAAES